MTPKGKRQAKQVSKVLKDFKIQAIYTSPLKRCKETAEIISRKQGLKISVDKNLIEISHGKWEGKKAEWVEKKYPKLYKTWKKKPERVKMPDGESCRQVTRRTEKFLKKIREFKDNIVVVSHDLVIRLIVAKALGLPVNNIWRIKLENGAINMIELGEKQRLIFLNQVAHLQKDRVDVDKQAL